MPVPSSIADLSTTAGSNSPAGTEAPSTLDNYQRAHASFIAQLRAVIGGAVDANIPNAIVKTTSATDTTADRVLKVGDFGLPTVANYLALPKLATVNSTIDLNTITEAGWFGELIGGPPGSRPPNYPIGQAAGANYVYLFVMKFFTKQTQVAYSYAAATVEDPRVWMRFGVGGVWTAWVDVALTSSPAFTGTPTAPTAAPGTNTTQLATTAFSKAAVDSTAIGVGQTWQDVSGSRSESTNYTNTTGKPIVVNINSASTTGSPTVTILSITVDGVVAAYCPSYTANTTQGGFASVTVPDGSVYSAVISNGNIGKWVELR